MQSSIWFLWSVSWQEFSCDIGVETYCMWDFQGEALLSTGWVKDCWASGVRQQLVNSDQSDPEQKAGGLGKKAVYKTSHPRALLKKKKKKKQKVRVFSQATLQTP